jgi:nucleotide-binding universal stress UspA family protein
MDSRRYLERNEEMTLPRRFLVPMDFSRMSEQALDYALDLAGRSDGYVVILHAITHLPHVLPEAISHDAARSDSAVKSAGRELDKLTEARKACGVPINVVVKHGVPWRMIIDTARELDVDVVVMGTHGNTALPRPLMGSVADKVVRMSPCPVLTIPDASVPLSARAP